MNHLREREDLPGFEARLLGELLDLVGERKDDATIETPLHGRYRSRKRWTAAAAIAAVLGAVVVLIMLQPGGATSASAAVRAAAVNTGSEDSFRAVLTVEYPDGTSRIGSAVFDGPDARIESQDRSPSGTVTYRESYTIIGDTIWTTVEGVTTSEQVKTNDRLAPFAKASETVVTAALQGSKVTDLGTDTLNGTEATHYRVELDGTSHAALGALTPSVLAWFELEYPEQVTTLDLWVSDGLIRRIHVVSDGCDPGCPTSTTEFSDFGADISIQPPA